MGSEATWDRPRILGVLLASPGDVQAERNGVPEVIDEINRSLGDLMNLRLELWSWETDAYPGFHAEGPQGLIDEILDFDKLDVVIGIFWNRFGTPTADAESGTEHELRKAWKARVHTGRPQIMVYLNQAPSLLDTQQKLDQRSAVLRFKGELEKNGIVWPYASPGSFSGTLRRSLENLLKAEYQSEVPVRRSDDPSGRRLCAVLPFVDISPAPLAANLSAGFAEELIVGLKYSPGLRVIDRTRTIGFEGRELSEVGRQLKVDVVLGGTYQTVARDGGQRIVIYAKLVESATGEVLHSFKHEGDGGYDMQVSLAQEIMAALDESPVSSSAMEAPATTDSDARTHYFAGLHQFDNDEFEDAIRHLKLAVGIDPGYRDAWFWLGKALRKTGDTGAALEALETAVSLKQEAV